MELVVCDHCKASIERKSTYFVCNISSMSYNIVTDELGYTLAREFNHKGQSKIILCKDCGEKILYSCRW